MLAASSSAAGRVRCGWHSPSGEFVGVAGVFVAPDGIEISALFHAVTDEAADGGGALDSALVAGFLRVLRFGDGVAVVAQILHEVVREFVGDEFRGERA